MTAVPGNTIHSVSSGTSSIPVYCHYLYSQNYAVATSIQNVQCLQVSLMILFIFQFTVDSSRTGCVHMYIRSVNIDILNNNSFNLK